MLHTDIKTFLKRLAAARDPLGLIVVGVDRESQFYDLDALSAGTAALWDKVAVRIYSEKDYRRRWAAVLRWRPLDSANVDGKGQRPEFETDREILRQRVLEAGLRTIARDTHTAASHLSTYLKHGRGLSIHAVAKVRQQVMDCQNLGGPAAFALFSGCKTLAEFAVAYRKLGWCVIPLVPGTRASYLKHWKPFQIALPTIRQVSKWWKMWPDASIGIVLGPISGLLVIDSDSKDANNLLLKLLGDVLKHCPKAASGSRGPGKYHYYFKHPALATRASNKSLHQQLEIRGTNGLIVAPPSVHKTGKNTYAWIKGQAIWRVPLMETPAVILEALQASRKRIPIAVRLPVPTIKGSGGFSETFSSFNSQRVPGDVAEFIRGEHAHTNNHDWNDRLFRCARWCRDHHVPQDLAEDILVKEADPTDSAEKDKVLNTIRSAYSHPPSAAAGS